MTVRPYWWKSDSVPGALDNFGDRLNGWLLMQLGVNPNWYPVSQANLVIVGSVLEHLPKHWEGTVCGAGLLRPHSKVNLSQANVLALRGELTQKRLVGGLRGLPALGDPGLLVSTFQPQATAKIDLGVIPHWSDTELYDKYSYGHLIDVANHPDQVIQEISRCKRVISSSLHGLVVADSFGIPRQAEMFRQAENEGGDFKFFDYQSVFEDKNPHFGEMWRAPHEEVERIQRILREALNTALGLDPQDLSVPDFDSPEVISLRQWARRPQISMLIPFRDDGEHRTRVFNWLVDYWTDQLSSIEIIQGHDRYYPFSKATAVNNAAERARGRVFVIMDADAYLDAQVVQFCADAIDLAVQNHQRLWFMPYDKLYRLNREATNRLLWTNPAQPYQVPSPPPGDWLEEGNSASYGHQYGALAQIMPAQAFFMAGGMDARFRGWGSEDASLLRALDTLYTQHQITHNDITHLWHVRPGTDFKTRRWIGQQGYGPANSRLAQRYGLAYGEPALMEALIHERGRPQPHSFWQWWGY